MPKVITQGSVLMCAHKGLIQLSASQDLLKIDGQAVLVEGDLDGAPISGCTTPVSQSTKPCTSVTGMSTGAATTLTVGGKAVLLETANGNTDGVAGGTNLWNVQSAAQVKLDVM